MLNMRRCESSWRSSGLGHRYACRRWSARSTRIDAANLEPPDDEHDPEGTTAYERARVTSLAAEARARLTQLDRVLTEIDDEGYGACQRCGQPIGWPRLQAQPGTTRCVRCAVSP
jgi:RNA polymerase-binding transcription factor DksA